MLVSETQPKAECLSVAVHGAETQPEGTVRVVAVIREHRWS